MHALVRIPELDAEQTFESRIELEYVTSNRSFKLEPGISSVNLAQSTDSYCRNDKFWETKDPLVRRTSESIRNSSRDVGEFLSRAFAWVRENVKLREPQPKRLGAAHTIRELTGDCDELSDLFIAFCRAAIFPVAESSGSSITATEPSQNLSNGTRGLRFKCLGMCGFHSIPL